MTETNGARPGLHVAVIMDGNGRWALERGLPRAAGYRAGGRAVRRVVEAAPGLGVETLTLFALSSDNLRRPAGELGPLLDEVEAYLRELAGGGTAGPRVRVIGRRDRIPRDLVEAALAAEAATSGAPGLRLRIAIDYSGRDAMLCAARSLVDRALAGEAIMPSREAFAELLDPPAGAPDVDLLIRTGGEKRLSDFLLWESAYAELFFTDVPWPEFDAAALAEALTAYHGRERRFGMVRDVVAR